MVSYLLNYKKCNKVWNSKWCNKKYYNKQIIKYDIIILILKCRGVQVEGWLSLEGQITPTIASKTLA